MLADCERDGHDAMEARSDRRSVHTSEDVEFVRIRENVGETLVEAVSNDSDPYELFRSGEIGSVGRLATLSHPSPASPTTSGGAHFACLLPILAGYGCSSSQPPQ